MSKNFNTVLFFFFQVIFFTTISAASIEVEIPEPDATVHEVMDDTIDILAKKYNLNPCGIGMNGKFEYLEISFQTSEILSKQKARVMLIDCVEIFLDRINTNEKIQPFLQTSPFTIKNVGIVIYVEDENKNDVFHPEIAVVRWSSNGVAFKTVSKENAYHFKEIYRETHEEAIAIVNKQKQQLAQQNPNE